MAVDNDLLLAAIDAARENSYGSDEQSSLGQRRARAIEAYLGLNNNPAPEGRSQVVDRSVYETIATIKPSLVRIFAGSSDEVCKCTPVGPGDEGAAEQQTAVLSYVVTQKNQWEQIFRDWVHDAMLLSNGYAMAYWDQSDQTTQEKYEGQSDDQVAMLMQDKSITIVQHTERPDEQGTADAIAQYKQALAQWNQAKAQVEAMAQAQGAQGQMPQPLPPPPTRPKPVVLHDLVIERKENDGKVCIEVLPPEHCTISADTPDWTLKDCPFFEFRQQKTIAQLRSMGLEVPDDISDDEDGDNAEDIARDRFGENRMQDESQGVTRQVWARMTWINADLEGKGESRMYYAIVVGRTPLYVEPVSRIPVASMVCDPLPHRHIGHSIADAVLDIQNIKTAVKRGGLDNLYLSNAPRSVISQSVNLDDFLDARPGGAVRMKDMSRPGEGHIVPLVHPFAFDQIIGSLEYFDQERQNRSGASRYFAGTDAGAINKTMGGTIALQNMAAMRVEDIARTMAPAVEYLFEIVQELISKHQNKALAIQLKGEWINVDPQAWRTKRDVRIAVGVGAGNKESMQAQLNQVLGSQVQVGMPAGLAGPEQLYETMIEMVKLAGFANPQKFYKKPKPGEQLPQQPSPEQIKAQTEMQKLQFTAQQDQQKFQAEQMAAQRDAERQMEMDRYREEMQARQKLVEAQISERENERQLEFERWKASLEATVKLEIANKNAQTSMETTRMGNEASMQTAQMSKAPDTRIDELLQTIQALQAEMEAPAEIVRGPDGRASHVKKGERVREIKRGPDGRAMGLH